MNTGEQPKRTWQAIALELSVEPSNSRVTELAKELDQAMEAEERQHRGMAAKPRFQADDPEAVSTPLVSFRVTTQIPDRRIRSVPKVIQVVVQRR